MGLRDSRGRDHGLRGGRAESRVLSQVQRFEVKHGLALDCHGVQPAGHRRCRVVRDARRSAVRPRQRPLSQALSNVLFAYGRSGRGRRARMRRRVGRIRASARRQVA